MAVKEIPLTDPFIASIAETSGCDAWIDSHQVAVVAVKVSGTGVVQLTVVDGSDNDEFDIAGSRVTVFASTLLDIIRGRLAHDNVCNCSPRNGKHSGTCKAGKLLGARIKISLH